MVNTIKFSEMAQGGDLATDDKTAGLKGGQNVMFNNPNPNLEPGTTATRPPVSPSMHYRLRFNATIEAWEYYSPVHSWVTLASSTGITSITGTLNQIDIDNTDPTNPILFLASNLIFPGVIGGDIDMDNHNINHLPLPTTADNPATKGYVDGLVLNIIAACNYATTANLAGYTYNNGASGVGATLTAPSNAAFTADGATPSLNDRIFVSFQTDQAENGVYVLTQTGNLSNPAILTRASDYNNASQMHAGDEVRVVGGNTLAGSKWMMTQTSPITVGTTPITWLEVSVPDNVFVTLATNQTITGQKTFTQPLDLISPDMTVGTNRNDAANKVWRPQIPNYNLADGYFVPFFSSATNAGNTVSIGGGTSLGNAASAINFFSAPNTTTPTGTLIADINNSGLRLGAGARVNFITNDNTMAAASATNLYTGGATKTYIDNTTWKFVSSQLISGSVASVEFTNIGNYRMYWIAFQGVTPSVIAEFVCKFSSDNGVTWLSSSSYSQQALTGSGVTVSTGSVNYLAVRLAFDVANSTTGVSGNLYIYNCNDSNKITSFLADTHFITGATRVIRDTRGALDILSVVNAFQFYYPASSITSGRITLYGAF